jgi:hypothetical protein
MNALTIRQVRCGIPDCDWGRLCVDQLTSAFVASAYSEWREHLADRHGLNLNTDELPGLTEARLHFDHATGAVTTVEIKAKGAAE